MSGPLFVKLETTWVDHPGLIAAGLDGRGLHAVCLCLAKRLETDGWIDRALLYREGAADDLIDRLVELVLLDAEGRRVRPAGWHDRNPSQGAIDATRTAKAEAARAGNHKRWGHPGPVASCAVCLPNVQVSRTSDPVRSQSVAEVSPDTETETSSPTKSQDYSQPDPQALAKAAALVARQIAATTADHNPAGLAATIARRINNLTEPDDDRDRILAALADGQTPEEIASGWEPAKPDWLAYAGGGATQTAPARPPLRPFSLAAHEAEAEAQRVILEAEAAAS